MNRLKWILLLTVVAVSAAEARPRRSSSVGQWSPTMAMPVNSFPAVSPGVVSPPVDSQAVVPQPEMVMPASGGLAQSKAQIQAQAGRCFHPGGSFGGGTHEGCGFSTVSADDAIRHCCYWGQRTPIDIGVAQGPNGWYATVIYR